MVFVLGRMGSAEKALRLIVEGLRDVVQVGGGWRRGGREGGGGRLERSWGGSAMNPLLLIPSVL
jgi:hypothetical protein